MGNLHPLLVHFPIALVLTGAAAEAVAMLVPGHAWRVVAVINLRAGAAFGVVTAIAGWLLASAPAVEPTIQLEWHRWMGVAGAFVAVVSALLSLAMTDDARRTVIAYRLTLFGAALFIAITGHLGGTLVWGSPFEQF